jgi:2-deoxy-D-gluconate 3-dehydrogenase
MREASRLANRPGNAEGRKVKPIEAMNRFRVDGKTAIVTGATTGIGRAAAIGLAEAGANVAVLGRTRNPTDTCDQIRAFGRECLPLQGDLCDRGFLAQTVDCVVKRWGRVDILVNSAGMTIRTPAAHFAEADWDKVISLNLTALFRMCQEAGRHMIEQGSGKIINVASIISFSGGINVPAYAASKGGVAQVTKALANEWAQFKVNVNAIAPGYILTEMTQSLHDDPARSREITGRVPAQRWGTPEDLVGAVTFLASPASDFVNGHILVVDGGWMAR